MNLWIYFLWFAIGALAFTPHFLASTSWLDVTKRWRSTSAASCRAFATAAVCGLLYGGQPVALVTPEISGLVLLALLQMPLALPTPIGEAGLRGYNTLFIWWAKTKLADIIIMLPLWGISMLLCLFSPLRNGIEWLISLFVLGEPEGSPPAAATMMTLMALACVRLLRLAVASTVRVRRGFQPTGPVRWSIVVIWTGIALVAFINAQAKETLASPPSWGMSLLFMLSIDLFAVFLCESGEMGMRRWDVEKVDK